MSYLFPINLNTYVMGLARAIRNSFTLTVRGSNRTSIDPRAVRVECIVTGKIRRTSVPQNAMVAVGRHYSIIILNMCFIPSPALIARSQIIASAYTWATSTAYCILKAYTSDLRAVPVKIRAPLHGQQLKSHPHPSGILGLWATTKSGFPAFFSTTVIVISSWLNIVFNNHPHGFLWKGGYEININPQVYSFHVIFNTETMQLSFTLSLVFIY